MLCVLSMKRATCLNFSSQVKHFLAASIRASRKASKKTATLESSWVGERNIYFFYQWWLLMVFRLVAEKGIWKFFIRRPNAGAESKDGEKRFVRDVKVTFERDLDGAATINETRHWLAVNYFTCFVLELDWIPVKWSFDVGDKTRFHMNKICAASSTNFTFIYSKSTANWQVPRPLADNNQQSWRLRWNSDLIDDAEKKRSDA